MTEDKFDFIDLFSGIGGFHLALGNLGGRCVFACDIDKFAVQTYGENFHMDSYGDIRDADETKIPRHDVLCAGFPCQSFSKAGRQQGFSDKTRGTLFFEIIRIMRYRRPKFFILENVRNLQAHDDGNTWKVMKNALKELGYVITETPILVSPHQFGIPQIRERVVILGAAAETGIKKIEIDLPRIDKSDVDFLSYGLLESGEADAKYRISPHEEKVLECWDEFMHGIDRKVIGFPIWSFEFGKDYDVRACGYPDWKQSIVNRNRGLYRDNREFIDRWFERWNFLDGFSATEKKFEWQCGNDCSSVWDGLIQFRPSGIRVKRPTVFPALVAMVQIPIVGKVRRRLTPREAARLQSFPDDFICNPNDHQAYKQFGNAVNVKVIEYIARELFNLNK